MMYHKKELLGEILIKRKVLDYGQLNKALKKQKNSAGHIGEILIELGYITERELVAGLVVQCHLPYIAIDKYQIDNSVIDLVPMQLARTKHLMPLDKVGMVLSVAMADPLDYSLRSELQEITQCRIAPFISTHDEIDRAIDQGYGKEVLNANI